DAAQERLQGGVDLQLADRLDGLRANAGVGVVEAGEKGFGRVVVLGGNFAEDERGRAAHVRGVLRLQQTDEFLRRCVRHGAVVLCGGARKKSPKPMAGASWGCVPQPNAKTVGLGLYWSRLPAAAWAPAVAETDADTHGRRRRIRIVDIDADR